LVVPLGTAPSSSG